IDFIEPQVSLIAPAGGEVIESGSPYTISWTSSDNVGIAAQEIRLSTDGGVTYPTVIASGLASSVQNFNWPVPADLSTNRARIKIICLDAAGNTGYDESSSDFSVLKTALPLDARNIGYEYDKLNRLTRSVSDGGIENNYAYDGLGNRLTLDTTADQPPSADFDHDGDVDWGDFAVFAASWLKRTGEPGYDPRCDFNHDGIVNFIDYATFANAWNPNPPAGLGAGAVSYSQIDLSWQDNSDGESGFKIERKMGAEGTYGQIAAVGQNVTTYSDTGLLAEQTYDYRVRAYGTTFGSTTSDYSNQASATTPPSNRSPILGSIANKTVNEGSPLQFTLLATDPDKDKLTYNAKTLPAGAALDSLSGKFSWTPGYNQAGKYKVTFTVSDGQLTDSEIIIIEVYGKPFLSYSYPRSGGPGTYLGIIGKDFGSRNSFSRVEFSGPGQSRQIQMDAQLIRWSDRYIICRVPKIKPGGYQFTVINQAGESKFRLFTVK
ncbi:MAG: putative Ig domain-containing protein, partial [Candidatus Omnitrophota bacterium]